MHPEDLSIASIVTAIFIGCMVLFGLALLFVKAANIERPILVGCMTLASSLMAVGLLLNESRLGLRGHTGGYLSLAVLALLGFVVGRVIDRILGPTTYPSEDEEGTIDAGLAD